MHLHCIALFNKKRSLKLHYLTNRKIRIFLAIISNIAETTEIVSTASTLSTSFVVNTVSSSNCRDSVATI